MSKSVSARFSRLVLAGLLVASAPVPAMAQFTMERPAHLEMRRFPNAQFHRFDLYSMRIDEFGMAVDGTYQAVLTVRNETNERNGYAHSSVYMLLTDEDGETKRNVGNVYNAKVSGGFHALERHQSTLWMEPGDEIRIRLAFPDSRGFQPKRLRLIESWDETITVNYNLTGSGTSTGGTPPNNGGTTTGGTQNGGTQNGGTTTGGNQTGGDTTGGGDTGTEAPDSIQMITTHLSDAKSEITNMDSFVPSAAQKSLLTLQRTPNGGFVVQPGYYSFDAQSYSVRLGAPGPSGTEGYLYAPLQGPAKEIVQSILWKSVEQPNIPQSDIQTLIWAITANAKYDEMGAAQKALAAKLMTPQQIAWLKQLKDSAPANAAEGDVRKMLKANGSFGQIERVAVPAKGASSGSGSRKIPLGRWNLHPDGYYVRYMPQGYHHVTVELWVPQGITGVGKEFDPAGHVAMPGNTARQGLVLSGRALD